MMNLYGESISEMMLEHIGSFFFAKCLSCQLYHMVLLVIIDEEGYATLIYMIKSAILIV